MGRVYGVGRGWCLFPLAAFLLGGCPDGPGAHGDLDHPAGHAHAGQAAEPLKKVE